MPSKIVLVTGGAGLVGKGIQMHLEKYPAPDEKWIYLSSKEGDLRKLEDTKAIFAKYKPTHVIHLAAMVGGLFKNLAYNLQFFRDNMAIDDNVLHCCNEFNVQKCVSCLSTCIFPDKTTYPLTEEMIHNGPPHESNEGYAYAKRMLDVLNKCYNRAYPNGCKYHSIIPTNIYGPYDNWNLQDSHVIPGLIHKCYLAKKNQQPFVVWGSGTPLRQFIYSEDLGALTVWTLRHYNEFSPLILSVGEEDEVSIADVAKLIAATMNYTAGLQFDTSKADGQFKKTASNKKLLSLYPTFKYTPVKEALQSTIKWFEENYDNARK